MKLFGGGGHRVNNSHSGANPRTAAQKAYENYSLLDDESLDLSLELETRPQARPQSSHAASADMADDWQPILSPSQESRPAAVQTAPQPAAAVPARPASTSGTAQTRSSAPVQARPAASSGTAQARPAARPVRTPEGYAVPPRTPDGYTARPVRRPAAHSVTHAEEGLDDWEPIISRPAAPAQPARPASHTAQGTAPSGQARAQSYTAGAYAPNTARSGSARTADVPDDWDPIISAALQPTVQLDPTETAAGQPAYRPRPQQRPQTAQHAQTARTQTTARPQTSARPQSAAHRAEASVRVPQSPHAAARAAQTASRTALGTENAVRSARGYAIRDNVYSDAAPTRASAGAAAAPRKPGAYRWVDDEDAVYTSSHGAAPRQPERAAGTHRRWPLRLGIAAVALIALYLFLVYTPNAFISRWRTIYIETAMSTKSHQWLATAFLPRSIINETLQARYDLDEEQEEMVSNRDLVKPTESATIDALRGAATSSAAGAATTAAPGPSLPVIATTEQQPTGATENTEPTTSATSLPAGVVSSSLAVPTTAPTAPPLPEWSDPEHPLYLLYPELDPESFSAYAQTHESTMFDADGYIMIDEANRDGSGTTIQTIHGDKVLALDLRNGILLVRVTGSSFNGVLAIVRNPSQVGLVVSNRLGSVGQRIPELCNNNNAVLGINASGFVDDEGKGNGGLPYGYVVSDGEVLNGSEGRYDSTWKIIGFDYDNILFTGSYKAMKNLDSELRDAAEFKPLLINNGEIVVKVNDGWGINPRTAMGQAADGSVLMIVINGRGTSSLGCKSIDVANILYRYGAIQASALDGGSSSVMYYNGRVITFPSGTNKTDGRQIPDAFVVYRAKS